MEKFSSFERVVGNIPESEKERIIQSADEMFDNQVFENLKGKEREKTSEELQIISIVNKATNEIRQKYGLEDFNISPKNIHIVSEKAWLELGNNDEGAALYGSMVQGIMIREQPGKIVFMKKLFHEMLHFKSYNALQVTIGENHELEEYRLGLVAHTRDDKKSYFINFNEAVTEEMTKRFAVKLIDNPLFAKELSQTKDVIAKYPRAVVTGSKEPLFDENTYYAEANSKKTWGEAIGRLFGAPEKSKEINANSFTYQPERKILNTLIDKIFERNLEKFQNRDEIFEVFAKGMITGNILPLGRLVDGTFGGDTLRRIGELDENIQAQEEFVNSL